MRFEVQRGYLIREGALLTKGSSFDAEESEVKTEIRKGIIAPVAGQHSKGESKQKKERDNDEL